MPTNKPFFPNLRPVKKVVSPKGQMLIRKECRCGNEFWGRATQTRCEKCIAKSKTEMSSDSLTALAMHDVQDNDQNSENCQCRRKTVEMSLF